jgi:hypothetical protein
VNNSIRGIIEHLEKVDRKIAFLKEEISNDIANENTLLVDTKIVELNNILRYKRKIVNWYVGELQLDIGMEIIPVKIELAKEEEK